MTAPTDTWLELAGAPPIDRLRFRRPRPDDAEYEALAELIGASSQADDIPWSPSGTMLREEWEDDPDTFVPGSDGIVAEVDGRFVAVAGTHRALRVGRPVYQAWGHVDPAWRRRGLGRAVLRENLRRANERALALGDVTAGGRAEVRGMAGEAEPGHQAILTSAGMVPIRWIFLMLRPTLDDIPDAPLPDGIELRPVEPRQHRAIVLAEHEAFRDHWEPRDFSEAGFTALFERSELDTSLWVVAWDGDEIAGVVQTWIYADENDRLGVERGWLERISVRRPWRRRGLGRAITAEALRRLRAAGLADAMLGVDADNLTGALGLYEGMGFEVAQRSMIYGWPTRE
jgi:mycothiol synthase